MKDSHRLELNSAKLSKLCEELHIRRLAIFGSALRDDFGPSSDIDLLVEFDPRFQPGWEIVDIADRLSEFFDGRRIDLVNPKWLHARLRDRILAEARTQYEARDAACGKALATARSAW